VRVSLTPDPQYGVFETMLVLDGQAVELNAHLERLASSLMVLYDEGLPGEAADRVREGAAGLEHGKLRIAIAPSPVGAIEAQPEIRVIAAPVDPAAVFPGPARGITLRSFRVEGGLGEHKWADRRLLEGAESGFSPRELALLVDGDGTALEASRASLFAVGDGWLAMPPADGRILPGIARRRTIETAREAGIEVREQSLPLATLSDHELFLAGSVRGIEPVLALDGTVLPPPGALSARVAAGLRHRWLPAGQGGSVAVLAGARPAGRPAR
jgi:para-aminobenzoate synthetase/4-amino-4-deoxychorismate lyase